MTSFFCHFSLIPTKKNSIWPVPRNTSETKIGSRFWVQDQEKVSWLKPNQGENNFSNLLPIQTGQPVESCFQSPNSWPWLLGHESVQVDNFAVSFFVSKIDRGDLSKSLRVILVTQLVIKRHLIHPEGTSIYGTLDDYDIK